MKIAQQSQKTSKLLLSYLEGEVTQSEAAEIEVQLANSPAAKQQLAKLRGMLDSLAEPDPALKDVDLVDNVHRLIQRPPLSAKRRPWAWRLAYAFGAACLALAIAVPIWLSHEESSPSKINNEEFRIKSAAPNKQNKWVSISVYSADHKGKAQRINGSIHKRDGLLFSYTNLKPHSYKSLMIFAIDTSEKIFWFYPAYEHSGSNPAAIKIKENCSAEELPDMIRHDFVPGPLAIYGIFLEKPLRVKHVESQVLSFLRSSKWNIKAPSQIPIEGSAQHLIKIRVK